MPPSALGPLDPVGAQERVVHAPHHRRDAVRRVEALVRIDCRRRGSRRPRPASPRGRSPSAPPSHLHGLAAGERAERRDVICLSCSSRQSFSAPCAGERVLDRHASRAARSRPRPCSPAGSRPTWRRPPTRARGRRSPWRVEDGCPLPLVALIRLSFGIRNTDSRILDGRIERVVKPRFLCPYRIQVAGPGSARAVPPDESTCSRASARAPLGLPAAEGVEQRPVLALVRAVPARPARPRRRGPDSPSPSQRAHLAIRSDASAARDPVDHVVEGVIGANPLGDETARAGRRPAARRGATRP